MNRVFGPVPSRRLGRSLGVDIVPFKTCSYDCVYCQVGRTTDHVFDRKEWAPLEELIAELTEKLDTKPDFITLSGSGEPTLYSRLGELIRRIKDLTDIPVAVLTNGSLLWREDVRHDLWLADLVAPSLDAGDEETFVAVNDPVENLTFEKMLEGLITFRREFGGQYWLEVLLLAGLNDSDESVERIAAAAKQIGPHKVQLNTVTRPPMDSSAGPVSKERLEELAGRFEPKAEVIADFRKREPDEESAASADAILEMLKRRPCTMDDIASGLGVHPNEAIKVVAGMESEGLVEGERSAGKLYYKVKGS